MGRSKILLFLCLPAFLINACSTSPASSSELKAEEVLATAQQIAATIIAETAAAVPPTKTLTPRPSPTSTSTPVTITATPPASLTPTEVPAFLTTNQSINCRAGPGINYFIATGLEQDVSAEIIGRNSESTWWNVQLSDSDLACWMIAELVTAQGNLALVEVVDAPPPPPPGAQSPYIQYYMILPNAGGNVVCGDSAFTVTTGALKNGDPNHDVGIALSALFSIQSEFQGGLMYAGYQSQLKYRSIEYNPNTQNANIYLTGSIEKPKEKCNMDRFVYQLRNTAQQFDYINHVVFWIGNTLVEDLLEP